MFKIGDKIRIVNDHDIWTENDIDAASLYTVVEDDADTNDYFDFDKLTIEIQATQIYPGDFVKVEEPVEEPRFSVEMEDKEIVQTMVAANTGMILAESKTDPRYAYPGLGLGVFRPDIETRKVGKVRVELVDDGFPLAPREIAKVMTWAQEAKGYKDHDWQNLPNAEVALAAAASRHRTDHIKQRVVDGLTVEQCVDGESALLHKAHEAFGVLAQLELMLRGDIK